MRRSLVKLESQPSGSVAALAAYLISLASFLLVSAPVSGDVLIRLSDEADVNVLQEIDGAVWAGTSKGAFEIRGNRWQHFDVPRVEAIAEVDGIPWLGTIEGIYRILDGKAEPFLAERFGSQGVFALHSADGVVWIGTNRGLSRQEQDGSITDLLPGRINTIRQIDGQIWVGTFRNAHFYDGAEFKAVFPPTSFANIKKIEEIQGKVWIIQASRTQHFYICFQIAGDGSPRKQFRVTALAESDGQIWGSFASELFKIEGGARESFSVEGGLEDPINFLLDSGDYFWAGTSSGLFRRTAGGFERFPMAAKDLGIRTGGVLLGKVWFGTRRGVFRLDEGVRILVEPRGRFSFSFGDREIVLGRKLYAKKKRYDLEGVDPYEGGDVETNFEVIMAHDYGAFREALEKLEEGPFRESQELAWEIPSFDSKFQIAVRDETGNLFDDRVVRVFAIRYLELFFLVLVLVNLLRARSRQQMAEILKALLAFLGLPILERKEGQGSVGEPTDAGQQVQSEPEPPKEEPGGERDTEVGGEDSGGDSA